MNRKILALNLALLAMLGTLGWMLRAHWRETRAQELATLAKAASRSAQLPPPSPAPPEAVVPANYLEVAQKTLFSRDRNPNVIIEPPPPPPAPKPEEPPPARPEYYGQMGLGEPVAFLSAEKGGQKGFRAGDKVGPFTLVAFNRETITFEWNGKTLEYPLAELKPKEPSPAAAQAAARAAAAGPNVSAASTIGVTQEKVVAGPGVQNGEIRSCVPGDTSPSGTVKDGFKKSIVPGAFGPSCLWEPIK
jgi:hypothetical protein